MSYPSPNLWYLHSIYLDCSLNELKIIEAFGDLRSSGLPVDLGTLHRYSGLSDDAIVLVVASLLEKKIVGFDDNEFIIVK